MKASEYYKSISYSLSDRIDRKANNLSVLENLDPLKVRLRDIIKPPKAKPKSYYRNLYVEGAFFTEKSKPLDPSLLKAKSLFSNKPDPSVHRHRIKRCLWGDAKVRVMYEGDGKTKKNMRFLSNAKERVKRENNRRAMRRLEVLKDLREVNMELKRRKDIVTEARNIQDIARQYSEKAMQTMADILDNPDAADSAKIAAANVILDRAHGKAPATNLNVNANMNANPKELDSRDLDQRIEDTLARVNNLTERETEETPSKKRLINLREYN